MDIKIVDMLNCADALGTLIRKEVPVRTAYKIARITKRFEAETEIFNDAKNAVFERYATVDGELQKRVPEKLAEPFKEEVDILLQQEVSIDLECISIDELGSIDIRPIDLYFMQPFICE